MEISKNNNQIKHQTSFQLTFIQRPQILVKLLLRLMINKLKKTQQRLQVLQQQHQQQKNRRLKRAKRKRKTIKKMI